MDQEVSKFLKSLLFAVSFIALLWLVQGLEHLTDIDMGKFGNLPRTLKGAVGIITGPLIHGDASHLLSNTFPLLLLITGVFYFYHYIAFEVFFWIYFMTGFWVWIAAREAYHIGASGLIYGLVAFLFFSGLFRKDSKAIAISLVVMFLYGGMFYGVFPSSGRISWESHLLGALAGVLLAFYFRKHKLYDENEIFQQAGLEGFDEELTEQVPRHINSTLQNIQLNYWYTNKKAKEAEKGNNKTERKINN
jgi:membrane associated rhomboid family serine protease